MNLHDKAIYSCAYARIITVSKNEHTLVGLQFTEVYYTYYLKEKQPLLYKSRYGTLFYTLSEHNVAMGQVGHFALKPIVAEIELTFTDKKD
jgi:hypothetical protein